jgi:hypothetical protein
LIPRLSSP